MHLTIDCGLDLMKYSGGIKSPEVAEREVINYTAGQESFPEAYPSWALKKE